MMEEIILDEVAWKMALSGELTEEELINSDLNKVFGFADPKQSNVIEFPFRQSDGKEQNIKAKIIMHPWDVEEKE